jgi:hypothetical protein
MRAAAPRPMVLPTRVLAPPVWTAGPEGFADEGFGAATEEAGALLAGAAGADGADGADEAGGAEEAGALEGFTTVAVLV